MPSSTALQSHFTPEARGPSEPSRIPFDRHRCQVDSLFSLFDQQASEEARQGVLRSITALVGPPIIKTAIRVLDIT